MHFVADLVMSYMRGGSWGELFLGYWVSKGGRGELVQSVGVGVGRRGWVGLDFSCGCVGGCRRRVGRVGCGVVWWVVVFFG